MSEHTPTPWYVDSAPWLGLKFGVLSKGRVICECREPEKDLDKVNAEHIAKCANYHDRLVEALDELLEISGCYSPNETDYEKAIGQARAIMAELSAHNGGEG